MKGLLLALVCAISVPAAAGCYGSGNLQTCTDSSGNSYTVNRIGGTTYVNGYNAQGQTWNSTSSTYGNTTYQQGTAKDGGQWNQTINTFGSGQMRTGTDSNGNSFSTYCYNGNCN